MHFDFYYLILISVVCRRSIASRTDLLGANTPELLLLSAAPNFCSRLEGLSKGQERFCTLYQDHMLAVAQGAGLAIKECQLQFQHRRWNCTAVDNKTDRVFGPVMKIGKPKQTDTERVILHEFPSIGQVC